MDGCREGVLVEPNADGDAYSLALEIEGENAPFALARGKTDDLKTHERAAEEIRRPLGSRGPDGRVLGGGHVEGSSAGSPSR